MRGSLSGGGRNSVDFRPDFTEIYAIFEDFHPAQKGNGILMIWMIWMYYFDRVSILGRVVIFICKG
jgi:hypothetical protein